MQTQAEIFASLKVGDIVTVETREIPGVLNVHKITREVWITHEGRSVGLRTPGRGEVTVAPYILCDTSGRLTLDAYFGARRHAPECTITLVERAMMDPVTYCTVERRLRRRVTSLRRRAKEAGSLAEKLDLLALLKQAQDELRAHRLTPHQ